MRYAIASLVLLLLLFGCTLPPALSGPQPPVSGSQYPVSGAEATCSDGTSLGACSSSKPFFCTASGVLESRPSLCGCPSGSVLRGEECISSCEDETPLNSCSPTRPFYCNQYGSIVEKASECGCPSNAIRSGESCIPACSDGTLPSQCSSTKPYYCTESLTLTPDPERCGCPSGTVLSEGECKAAKCIDDTPVGGCSANMLPMYCDETLTLVRNPRVCGCLADEILSEDESQCLDPDALVYEEGDTFKVFGDAYMRIDEAEWVECATGDYIRLRLQIDNSEGDSPYGIYPSEFRLLQIAHGSQTGTWISVGYPSHDGLCAEPNQFAWTYTMPGDINTGMVWFRLPGFYDSNLEYSVYYKGIRIELSP
ncbi:MAG: hypothetical protein AB1657_03890 [Candidatus Micrarchaeota archaeon]